MLSRLYSSNDRDKIICLLITKSRHIERKCSLNRQIEILQELNGKIWEDKFGEISPLINVNNWHKCNQ